MSKQIVLYIQVCVFQYNNTNEKEKNLKESKEDCMKVFEGREERAKLKYSLKK